MNLPFTVEQFLDVFRQYNLTIWPLQMIAYVLGISAVLHCLRKKSFSEAFNALLLAFFWIWTGVVYHILFFSRINRIATIFGGLFVLQGLIFLNAGALRRRLSFGFRQDIYSFTGLMFVLYAMVIYPAIGSLVGHSFPNSPMFGVAPCPVTIFTFGLLLMTDKKVPKYFLVIPLLWSLIGFTAALKLGIREDVGLLIAGVLGTAMLFVRDRAVQAAGASSPVATTAPKK